MFLLKRFSPEDKINPVKEIINSEGFKILFDNTTKSKYTIYLHQKDILYIEEAIMCHQLTTSNWMYIKSEDALLHLRINKTEMLLESNKEFVDLIKYDINDIRFIQIKTINFSESFNGVYLYELKDWHCYYNIEHNKLVSVNKEFITSVIDNNIRI